MNARILDLASYDIVKINAVKRTLKRQFSKHIEK